MRPMLKLIELAESVAHFERLVSTEKYSEIRARNIGRRNRAALEALAIYHAYELAEAVELYATPTQSDRIAGALALARTINK